MTSRDNYKGCLHSFPINQKQAFFPQIFYFSRCLFVCAPFESFTLIAFIVLKHTIINLKNVSLR